MKKIILLIYSYIKNHLSVLSICLVIICVIIANNKFNFWKVDGRIIAHDVIQYYGYLPASFIYKDLTLGFKNDNPEFFKNKLYGRSLKNGNTVFKMTMGMSFLYLPFFYGGHVYAKLSDYPDDGYSVPYKKALIVSAIFYLTIGLIITRKILKIFYSETVTSITIICIGLGTNLYFYSVLEPAMSHVYSFFLVALFIYLTFKWHLNNSLFNSILIGIVAGLISLIRPTNIVVALFFIFWNVGNIKELKVKTIFFAKKIDKITWIIVFAAIIWIPQLLYWKYVTGSYFYYSYGNEGFNFNDPNIINGLISYKKGWLVYTPLMIFSLSGLFIIFFRNRKLFFPIFIFFIANIYLMWSWWCWWYGGGFGQRPMIDSYAILSIPLAATTSFILKKKMLIYIPYLLILSMLIFLNNFQTNQFFYESIHWDSMNKDAYWHSFGLLRPDKKFHEIIYEQKKAESKDTKNN